MNTAAHPVAPEDLMALLDGELTAPLAESINAHLAQCDECAGIVAQLRSTSESLARWTVPAFSSQIEHKIMETADAVSSRTYSRENPTSRLFSEYWKPIALCICLALIVVFVRNFPRTLDRRLGPALPERQDRASAGDAAPPQMQSQALNDRLQAMASMDAKRADVQSQQMALAVPLADTEATAGAAPAPAAPAPYAASSVISAPMIARSANINLVVKDFPAARAALDSILARHHGYFAQLAANTQVEGAQSLTASLRIPASDRTAILAEIRNIGRVLDESQSGEEVTDQHQDLVARLQTARETEERFRTILQQRTGNLADVLSVEESIARVRGDIERMEGEQKILEHRVEFVSVEIQLREEYKEQLEAPADHSIPTRIRNAFVAGLRNAFETVVGIILFVEEYGPTSLIWLVVISVPLVVWKLYRSRTKF